MAWLEGRMIPKDDVGKICLHDSSNFEKPLLSYSSYYTHIISRSVESTMPTGQRHNRTRNPLWLSTF